MRWMLPLLLCAQASLSATNLLTVGPSGGSGAWVLKNTVGYSFTVGKHPLQVTRIGIYNWGNSSQLNADVEAGLWTDDGTLIATATIPSYQTVLEANFWWVNLPANVTLEPHSTYRIGTHSLFAAYWPYQQSPDTNKVSSAVAINGQVSGGHQSGVNGLVFPNNLSSGWIVGPNLTFDILPYDTTPPVITLNGANPQTVYRGMAFTDLGATVTDDFDAARTITGSGSVDTSTVGSYTLTYSAQDEVGNVATPVTRTVEVVLDPNGDEENDGLNNTEEANLGTNPYLRDTDGDGVNDLREVGDGTDPLDPASFDSLNLGLVAYYPFNGNANDESGNGNHGYQHDTVSAADRNGLSNAAVYFNGTSAYTEYPRFNLAGSRTFSGWVRTVLPEPTPVASDAVLFGQFADYAGSFQRWHLNVAKDALVWYESRGVGDDNDPFVAYGTLPTKQWFHYLAVLDTETTEPLKARLYINGREFGKVSSRVIAELDANYQSMRQMGDFGVLNYKQGFLDDLRVYNRALNAGEVASLFASERYSGFGLEGAATKSPFDPATAANWSAGGTAWTVDTSVTYDGSDSVKARTTDGQSTYREYTVTGPAVVDFWWKVSSEQLYDTFSYSLNGVNQETISGEVDWTYRTLTLPEGTHTIRWTYTKDVSDAVGQDAGWLDDFAVYPATATLQVRDGSTVLDGEVTVDFGDADIGSAGFTKTLNFTNEGYVPLEVELSLPADSPFSFIGGATKLPTVIQRGQSADVRIFLSTESTGSKTALLTIDAADSTLAPPVVTLTGDVLGPVIGVSFGGSPLTPDETVDMGLAPKTLEFTIRNDGNVGNLDITQISTTGNFQIVEQPSASIAPQGSTTFKVLAQSGAIGSQTGSVVISSSDGFTPTFNIPLTAEAFFGTANGITDGTVATSGTGGALGWSLVSTQLPDGSTGQALKTGTTPNDENSVLEMVAEGAAVVSWSWRASAQENFDWLLCEVDGQEVAGISTKNGVWQTQVVQVPAGASIRWVYRKDAAFTAGEDAGYLADVEFRSLAANQSFSQWAATHGIYDPQQRLPMSGLKAMFAWLGGFDPAVGTSALHRDIQLIPDGNFLSLLLYRFSFSKTADGTQQILFSPDMISWTTRRISQRIVSEDADRVIIEATAPSGTKGFFKVVGGGDTSGIMVRVQGGALPQSSGLAGTVVANFQVGKTEVTWADWKEVRDWALTNGYSDLAGVGVGIADDYPVHAVNWYDALKWCNAKSEKQGLAPRYRVDGSVYRTGGRYPTIEVGANGYRLPTEAEWEWAARGGASSQGYVYSGSNDVNAVAWYWDNSSATTRAVGAKASNELGIDDMSGNVREWCEDGFSTFRALRGGSHRYGADGCAVELRSYLDPAYRWSDHGFRVARDAEN